MPFTNPAAGAWPSTAAVRAGRAGAREGRDSCCRCQALSLRRQTAAHARWKMSSSATGKTLPPGFPQRTVPRPWRPETPYRSSLTHPAPPVQAAPRLAARRCGKQLLLAGDVGMPPGCFRGLCSGRGGAQIAFEPPILTEGLDGERFPSLTRITMYSGRPRRLWARPAPLHHNVLVAPGDSAHTPVNSKARANRRG